jgi:hypothetical protein
MIISQDHGRRLPTVLLSAIRQDFMPNRSHGGNRCCVAPGHAASLSMKAEAAPQNGDEMAINRPNDRFSNRAFRLQASTTPAIEHLSVASPDSCTESAAEPSSPEQAMISQQAMMKDTLSPHTPSPKTENRVPSGGLCRIRRMSTLRSTRQDAQINYLSTLSIFMKQTTYLATLPKRSGRLLNSTMVSINAPTRIGQATAMPAAEGCPGLGRGLFAAVPSGLSLPG